MPSAAPRPCPVPGCGKVTLGGRCPEHRLEERAREDRHRGSPRSRGYDSDWERLRKDFLRDHPICECDDCLASGRPVPATVVDHRIPIAERPDLRLVWSNLRAMSKPHHDAHTARTRGFGRGGRRKF